MIAPKASSFAEWLLRRSMDRTRATAVVGDLLESEQGSFWFWIAITRIVFQHAWRLPVAFYAALFAGTRMIEVLNKVLFYQATLHHRSWFDHESVLGVRIYFVYDLPGIFIGGAGLCSGLLVYAAIRYGTKHRVVYAALAWTVLLSACVCIWWQPAVLVAFLCLVVCLFAGSFLHPDYRRSTAVLFASLAAPLAIIPPAAYLQRAVQHSIYPGLVGTRELQQHPALGWLGLAMLLTIGAATAGTCSLMHRILFRPKSMTLVGQ